MRRARAARARTRTSSIVRRLSLAPASPVHTRAVRTVMVDQGIEMLADAVARNAAAVISLPTGGELHHHKTRFLGPDEQGVWLESVAGQGRQIAALMDASVPVGV